MSRVDLECAVAIPDRPPKIPLSDTRETTPMLSREVLNQRGPLLLDGGLATELERMGHDLDHTLWRYECQ